MLLGRVDNVGVGAKALEWFRNWFLTDHSTYVEGHRSKFLELSKGSAFLSCLTKSSLKNSSRNWGYTQLSWVFHITVTHNALTWSIIAPNASSQILSFQTHRWVLQRRLQHRHSFRYKSILGRLPPHLCSLLTPTYRSCSFRSIGWQLFQIPRVFTELGKSVFSYFAPLSWNTCQNTLQLTAFISLGGENLKESILVQSEPNDTQMTESRVLTFLWIYLWSKI